MTKKLRVVMAQLNLTVGDLNANLKKHLDSAIAARDKHKADLIVFPELGLTGYPPEDLLLRDEFIDATAEALKTLISSINGIYCMISYPEKREDGLYNTCALIHNGKIIASYAKNHLPNYGVFDEKRYFTAGKQPCVAKINDIPIGIIICEDIWYQGPIRDAVADGARVIFTVNASPFEIDKHNARIKTLTRRAREHAVPIFYINQVGGQDEIVYDGGSMVIDSNGELCQLAGYFEECLHASDVEFTPSGCRIPANLPDSHPSIDSLTYQALVMSVRDYITKNKFPGVLIGVSGGIDSALTLAIAVDALGKDRVKAIIMPSRHTSTISMEEALAVVNNLGVKHEIISIEPAYQAAIETLSTVFNNIKPDKTEENLQARCRAIILMALSNKFGHLVLTTGNRSELAVGYCTLYGDMAGGFCVLKDIPKTTVYALANYRNGITPIIPDRTLTRAPTAELAPGQKDEDSLPPYPILDKILFHYLNQGKSIDHIVQQGFDRELVLRVIQMVQNNEYKRRQAAIGPRVNHKSFGRDWRYPITNRFKV